MRSRQASQAVSSVVTRPTSVEAGKTGKSSWVREVAGRTCIDADICDRISIRG
jgi:hypothetical protein